VNRDSPRRTWEMLILQRCHSEFRHANSPTRGLRGHCRRQHHAQGRNGALSIRGLRPPMPDETPPASSAPDLMCGSRRCRTQRARRNHAVTFGAWAASRFRMPFAVLQTSTEAISIIAIARTPRANSVAERCISECSRPLETQLTLTAGPWSPTLRCSVGRLSRHAGMCQQHHRHLGQTHQCRQARRSRFIFFTR